MSSERNALETAVIAAASDFDYLRFNMSDLHGIPRGKTISTRNLQRILEEGGMGVFVGRFFNF